MSLLPITAEPSSGALSKPRPSIMASRRPRACYSLPAAAWRASRLRVRSSLGYIEPLIALDVDNELEAAGRFRSGLKRSGGGGRTPVQQAGAVHVLHRICNRCSQDDGSCRQQAGALGPRSGDSGSYARPIMIAIHTTASRSTQMAKSGGDQQRNRVLRCLPHLERVPLPFRKKLQPANRGITPSILSKRGLPL